VHYANSDVVVYQLMPMILLLKTSIRWDLMALHMAHEATCLVSFMPFNENKK
jgi:hypothetical protein